MEKPGNKKGLMAVLLCVAMAFAACTTEQGESKESKKKGKGKSVSDTIKDDIGLLASTTDWAEAQQMYKRVQVDIRDNVKNELTQDDLKTLANRGYCRSMDTIMRIILKGECEPRHGELKALHAERQKFDVKSGLHDEVESLYAEHQRVMEWIGSIGGRQTVKSFADRYNTQYDKEIADKAKVELDKKPSCKEIKRKLEKPYLEGRHARFCDDIVANLEANSTDPNDANIVRSRLGFYRDKYGSNDKYASWIKRLDTFSEEHSE